MMRRKLWDLRAVLLAVALTLGSAFIGPLALATSFFADNVQMTVSGAPGMGTITLGAAVSGFQSFTAASVPNGATVSYLAQDSGGVWEIGRGTYNSSASTLTRGALWGSSGAATAVTLSSAAIISLTMIAEDMPDYVPPPGGRLTLTSGVAVMQADQVAATTLYYAPFTGRSVPIYNGQGVQPYQFTSSPTDAVGLTLALGSNWAASTLYDVFVALNGSTPTLCTGPAWASSAAGTSSRGSGAGTTQLAPFNGLMTNAVSMTCRYSNTATFIVPANQATYVGSFVTNGTPGQTDFLFGSSAAGGGKATFTIWNAYNQVKSNAFVQDSNVSWTAPVTIGPLDASTNNRVYVVNGLDENRVSVSLAVRAHQAASTFVAYYIGINSTTSTVARSVRGFPIITSVAIDGFGIAMYDGDLPLGLNYIQALEGASTAGQTSYGVPDQAFSVELVW